jgi:hypothetical protein
MVIVFLFPENRYIYFEIFKEALPSKLIKTSTLRDALRVLRRQGKIAVCWEVKKYGKRGKRYVDLFPQFEPNPPHGLVLVYEL